MGNETEREAFEQLVRETCSTDEYTFKRDGGAYFRMTCAKTYDGLPAREMASVQTLWNFYQAGAAYQRAQPSGIEITKLLSCVRYLTGIAERGLKRQIREDESVESFVLGYVQSLETQPSDDVAKDAARYQWLVKHSTYGIDYRQRPELTLSIYAPDHRDGLSAAIDAAMAGGE